MSRGLDVGAFEALYRDAARDVYGFVAGMVRDRELAEEITAATFEKALRKRDTFDASKGSPRGWLFGVARNTALDELRRGKRTEARDELPEFDDPGVREEAEELRARRLTVEAAVAGLEERDRQLVAMRYFGDLTHAEIGQALGITESNAGTLLHRAVAKLRRACVEVA